MEKSHDEPGDTRVQHLKRDGNTWNVHHREVGQLEALLKQLLNRRQDTIDIQTESLALREMSYSASDLLNAVTQQNPDIQSQRQMIRKAESQVELGHKEFRPDFGKIPWITHESGYWMPGGDRRRAPDCE
jgi:hypothetical protein